MAQNFNQKTILESNNTPTPASASTGGAVVVYASFILIVPAIWYVARRNWFKQEKEKMLEQLSNIDAKLTERYNVLVNQLAVAKEALKHETDLQTEVTNARAAAAAPQPTVDPNQVMNKNQLVSGLSARWNLVQENYPQLVTMPVMMQLAASVKDLEADLEASRRFYTTVAREYNAGIQVWPSNVPARDLKLARFPMFEAEDERRQFVEMKF